MAFLWRDDDDLRSIRLLEPRRERTGELLVREVLVLDVNRLLRLRDRIQEQRLTLANRRLRSVAGIVLAIATLTSVKSGVISGGQRFSAELLTGGNR